MKENEEKNLEKKGQILDLRFYKSSKNLKQIANDLEEFYKSHLNLIKQLVLGNQKRHFNSTKSYFFNVVGARSNFS